MAQGTQVFRIFISSTFADLKVERNALQDRVWPRLRALCARHGARFQAIDLRWGVSQEASLDQQTLTICLDEIARCQRVSKRPNFVVLLGDRYGSRLLPAHIPAPEFEALRAQITPDHGELLNAWYRRDDNAVPAEYVLKPRTPPFDDNALWENVERELRGILSAAAQQLPAGSYDPTRYRASATEQEIQAGVLRVKDAGEHVHCFFRSITNLETLIGDVARTDAARDEEQRARSFVEVDTRNARDGMAERDLAALKHKLQAHLPAAHIHRYAAQWTGEGLTTDHITPLCNDVYIALAGIIEGQLAQRDTHSVFEREDELHALFGTERREHFQGRESIRKTIADYLTNAAGHPLVIHGASGAGKSALMAQTSAEASVRYPNAVVLVRFIGATPQSADPRTLLQSLSLQIAQRYRADTSAIPSDYEGLVQEFPRLLGLATARQPLMLFVDALDQLAAGKQQAPGLNWVPTNLPEHVYLVVSTLSDSGVGQLQRRLPASSLVELERMSGEDGAKLLDRWLVDAQPPRTLQPQQRDEVLSKFAVHGLPLYLRLAYEEARRWHSYTPSSQTLLDPEIQGITRQLFARLSAPANHGSALVAHGLGYLAAARSGLSEDELLDVLSEDTDVLRDFHERSPKSPPTDRLPVVIWSRLYFDLEPYLTEHTTEGATTLIFYHRQLGEVANDVYLSGAEGLARHRGLARYFAPSEGEAEAEAVPNLRRLTELPYQQTMGELWDEVYATLTDFRFLEQKATYLGAVERTDIQGNATTTYTGVYLLQEDYELVLRQMPV